MLVEQDITKALAVSDYGYVIENGHVVLEQTAEELEKNSRKEWYMFADEACRRGIIDGIIGEDIDIAEVL